MCLISTSFSFTSFTLTVINITCYCSENTFFRVSEGLFSRYFHKSINKWIIQKIEKAFEHSTKNTHGKSIKTEGIYNILCQQFNISILFKSMTLSQFSHKKICSFLMFNPDKSFIIVWNISINHLKTLK